MHFYTNLTKIGQEIIMKLSLFEDFKTVDIRTAILNI